MFPELHAKLGIDGAADGDGDGDDDAVSFVNVLEEEDQCGAFLIHHFLSHSLREDRSVVLVGAEQSMGHYHAVSLRLGNNLARAREKGQLCFVEWLREGAEAYCAEQNGAEKRTSSRALLERVRKEVLALKDLRPGGIVLLKTKK